MDSLRELYECAGRLVKEVSLLQEGIKKYDDEAHQQLNEEACNQKSVHANLRELDSEQGEFKRQLNDEVATLRRELALTRERADECLRSEIEQLDKKYQGMIQALKVELEEARTQANALRSSQQPAAGHGGHRLPRLHDLDAKPLPPLASSAKASYVLPPLRSLGD
ncbi:hypothetical protein AURDEDRAFT_172521 [Auricularia subglabra TFB-10046 SS5]|nr:hypothetical protein AURDEDRAFT_172521 [Auricularia subglabra TFB-10046 SS5]